MKPGDWSDLKELSSTALLNRLLTNLDALVSVSNDPAEEDESVRHLPEPLAVLYHLNWLDFEVMQGSLLAYMMNSHGRHARSAAAALRVIHADRMAVVLDEAIEVVNVHRAAWDERRTDLDQLPPFAITAPYGDLDGNDEISDLTDRYWLSADEDDWGERLEIYLKRNVDAVLEWATL